MIASTGTALAVDGRTRPWDELAGDGVDDWFVPRGVFSKGMGKSSTVAIFASLLRSSWPRVSGVVLE